MGALLGGRSGFLLGANLPWVSYGCDFGSNAWHPAGGLARPQERTRAGDALRSLRDSGAQAVRWFLLCDGRSGLHSDSDGVVTGLDERFFPDLDAALALLEETGLAAIFVLFDFLWFRRPHLVNGVQLGGRTYLLHDRDARARFGDAVLRPTLEHCGDHPAIAAWDVINEPEWAVTRLPSLQRRRVSRATMRAVIAEAAALVHACTRHPVTVGCAYAAGLPLVAGLGLDFYQVHWYPRLRKPFDVRRDVSAFGLDRPVLLGEFPTSVPSLSPAALLDAARSAGYAGALGWSVLAEDEASDRAALEEGLRLRT